MSTNGLPPLPQAPPNPAELRVGIDPVQGGVQLTLAYPHLMTRVIIAEAALGPIIKALEKARGNIPKVIIPP